MGLALADPADIAPDMASARITIALIPWRAKSCFIPATIPFCLRFQTTCYVDLPSNANFWLGSDLDEVYKALTAR
jgi:hypothetical protein